VRFFRGKLKRRLRQIDAVIVPDLGAGERLPHLVGIPAGNVEKGEGLGDGCERPMQDRSHFLMGERIAIDQFLIGRPLLLKLLEHGAVGDRAFGMWMFMPVLASALLDPPSTQARFCKR
jgi:hypothetical protein